MKVTPVRIDEKNNTSNTGNGWIVFVIMILVASFVLPALYKEMGAKNYNANKANAEKTATAAEWQKMEEISEAISVMLSRSGAPLLPDNSEIRDQYLLRIEEYDGRYSYKYQALLSAEDGERVIRVAISPGLAEQYTLYIGGEYGLDMRTVLIPHDGYHMVARARLYTESESE